jgi:hypothetical protein
MIVRKLHRHERYEHDGEFLTIAEWSARTGITVREITQRMRHGRTLSQALTFQSQPKKRGRDHYAPADPILNAWLRLPSPESRLAQL